MNNYLTIALASMFCLVSAQNTQASPSWKRVIGLSSIAAGLAYYCAPQEYKKAAIAVGALGMAGAALYKMVFGRPDITIRVWNPNAYASYVQKQPLQVSVNINGKATVFALRKSKNATPVSYNSQNCINATSGKEIADHVILAMQPIVKIREFDCDFGGTVGVSLQSLSKRVRRYECRETIENWFSENAGIEWID